MITGQCKLCGTNGELKKSHIISGEIPLQEAEDSVEESR